VAGAGRGSSRRGAKRGKVKRKVQRRQGSRREPGMPSAGGVYVKPRVATKAEEISAAGVMEDETFGNVLRATFGGLAISSGLAADERPVGVRA